MDVTGPEKGSDGQSSINAVAEITLANASKLTQSDRNAKAGGFSILCDTLTQRCKTSALRFTPFAHAQSIYGLSDVVNIRS